MNNLNRILLEGYLELRQGEHSFRDWIARTMREDDFPINLIMFQYDDNLGILDASEILKSEFDTRSFSWPQNELNESEYLQSFLVYLYACGKIRGVELAAKCKAIDWDFATATKFKSIWDGICEDVDTFNYPPPYYFFCLKGQNIEQEIFDYLFRMNILTDKSSI